MTQEHESPAGKIYPLSLVMILITVALSVIALFLGVATYQSQDSSALLYMLIGFIGLAISAYLLLQARRRPQQLTLETPQVITTLLCQKCGFKNVRDFQRGDFVFKETEPCQQCNEKMMIASIYREVKEKEK